MVSVSDTVWGQRLVSPFLPQTSRVSVSHWSVLCSPHLHSSTKTLAKKKKNQAGIKFLLRMLLQSTVGNQAGWATWRSDFLNVCSKQLSQPDIKPAPGLDSFPTHAFLTLPSPCLTFPSVASLSHPQGSIPTSPSERFRCGQSRPLSLKCSPRCFGRRVRPRKHV